jgi:Flp pilus assembly pilin Flp
MKKNAFLADAQPADRRSLTPLEYALISCILFAVVFLGFAEVADSLSNEFSNLGNSISTVAGS